MAITVLLLIVGLALVVFGADWLVDGASSIARKLGVSEFVIGLTIVGFGTSCPELVVSVTGALQGNADVSIGNVVGSNLMNTLLILGLSALLVPVSVTRENTRRDIPLAVVVTFLLAFCGMSVTLLGIGNTDGLTRLEGFVFLAVFVAYLIYSFKTDSGSAADDNPEKTLKPLAAVGLVIAGLAGLIFGGQLFVNNAEALGRALGASDKFIAITVLAGGTSLPELVTCLVAIAKKKDQLALGNILGSNVFNILLILGTSAAITPMSFAGLDLVDLGALIASAVAVWLWTYTGHRDRIDRWEGALMILGYAGYIAYLFMKL